MRTVVGFAVLVALVPFTGVGFGVSATAPPSKADVADVVCGNNLFAVGLYRQLAHHKGDLCVSPHSVYAAMAMVSSGARGATAEELAAALHLRLPEEQLHPAFAQLWAELRADARKRHYGLTISTAAWGQKGHALRAKFRRGLALHYETQFGAANFEDATDDARKAVNTWVGASTSGRIKELLRAEDVRPRTQLVVANAIHLRLGGGSADKQKRPSCLPLCAGMRLAGEAGHDDLPQSLILFLTRRASGAGERGAAAGEGEPAPRRIDPAPPSRRPAAKAKTIASQLRLARDMELLGMPDASSPGADLSGMNGWGRMYVAGLVHAASITTTTEATEAVAVTAVVIDVLDRGPICRAGAGHEIVPPRRPLRPISSP